MSKYAGLMIAGPMAGQMLVHHNTKFQCQERPPLKEALRMSVEEPTRCRDPKCPQAKGPAHHHGNPQADWSFTTHTYTWTHIGPFALWLHESTDLNHALNDMAVAYQEKHS